MKGIGRSKFIALFSAADAAFSGVPNYGKYYRKCEKAWDARFDGTDKYWCEELGTSHFMKHYFCVIKL